MEKPESPSKYIKWWNANFEDKIGLSDRKLYADLSELVRYDFDHSDAFVTFIHQLHNYDAEYNRRSQGYELLMRKPEEIKLEVKHWENFISKVWRKNVVLNTHWNNDSWSKEHSQPDGGWVTPSNWFERIHDIVRARIVVKYFDGVQLLLNNMCDHFSSHGCEIELDWEAREEGYYAAHLNVIQAYQVPVGLGVQTKKVSVEIQIATQINDVIADLTHKYYERRRETLVEPDIMWQWNYKSEEFSPNYIGHILHYVDGIIMQIRDKEQSHGKGQ